MYHIADKCAISRNKNFFHDIQTTKIREIVRPFLNSRKYASYSYSPIPIIILESSQRISPLNIFPCAFTK